MEESKFLKMADEVLDHIRTTVEDATDEGEIERREGILTLTLEDGRLYILNRHTPKRQIWLASPLSGPHHFYFNIENERWQSTRDEQDLFALLSMELTSLLSCSICL